MTNNRFIYLILAAFVGGMLLLVYIQYNSARNIDKLIDGNARLLRELKTGNDLREMERDILSVESKIRAAVATEDSSFTEGINQQIANAEANLDTLRLINDDSSSIADIDRLAALAREKLSRKDVMLDSFFRFGKKPDKTVIANPRTRGAANEINTIIRRLYNKRNQRLAAVSLSIQKNGKNARTSGTILITLVLLAGTGLFLFVVGRIRRQNELILQLDTSDKKLREAARVKENFLANMSHEIRTPLNSIIGFTSLLSRRPLDETSQEFVTAIGSSGENLLAIINDILDMSKIEAGMIRLESNPFSVRELTHSIETLFGQRVLEKGLAFHTTVEENVPNILIGDAVRLTQILVNLIGNALKFTEKGQIDLHLHAEQLQQDQVELGVTLSDTGIGISQEHIGAIFDRFSQAEDSTTRKYGGTGLGLAIVKDLVQLQRGEINVDSEAGKGTSFRFHIPYRIQTGSITAGTPVTNGVSTFTLPPDIRILVVDDNEMNQRLLRHLFTVHGISFDTAYNGERAVELLQEREYGLVLMDIQMPVMDGYTASRHIRDQLKLDVPIIAMTAHVMPGERERCLGYGMNDYISKPIVDRDLFLMIKQWLPPDAHRDLATEQTGATAGGANHYQYIDTAYLLQLSNGDRHYEIEMTDQFLESVPAELAELRAALDRGDLPAISHIAHNMKTTVSIMGLSASLQHLLEALEYPDKETNMSTVYEQLLQIGEKAMQEARLFRL
jgi:signal transduction histidine kinase/CheY-like chemotaxis protein